jgi:hypothetical protein
MIGHGALADGAVGRVARAAGRRLAVEHGPGLEHGVEAALHSRGTRSGGQYLDPVSLGSLVVSVATLAWTVYQDLRTKTERPAPEAVARRIRIELDEGGTSGPAELEAVVDVVVEEIVKDGGD